MDLERIIKAAVVLMTCGLVAINGQGAGPGPERAGSGVSDARFARLRRGINTSHWFAQAREYTKAHLETHTTAADIALIKTLGFDHIRLSVEPAPLFNRATPAALNAEYLRYLDDAIQMILAQNLAVIVDIHPADEFKKEILSTDDRVEAFAKFWRALAQHLAGMDPERVFLEVINEPLVQEGDRWRAILTRLVAAIRDGAPRHTIIVSGHRWSSLPEFLALQPVADRNVVYNFHMYDPHTFTHQGATWGADFWPYLKGLPYPSSPEAVAKLVPSIENKTAQGALIRYGEERWNAARIEAEVAKAAAWGAKYGVRVTCNEFGVYRKYAPPEARAAWIRDVRTALEKHGIGWAMWDYAGGFGVVVKQDGRPVADEATVAALGLKRSAER
jgi:aryl-phospho-beta-D-glucosidase BglC (GH1 family)